MKTAEEWANETGETVMSDCFAGDRNALPGDPTISLIRKIQLDAYKAGMTEAAEIAEKYVRGERPFAASVSISRAILQARDNKTSLP